VSNLGVQKRKGIEVDLTFEPGRQTPEKLARAYSLLIPVARRQTRSQVHFDCVESDGSRKTGGATR
jgi:hypothetical protein